MQAENVNLMKNQLQDKSSAQDRANNLKEANIALEQQLEASRLEEAAREQCLLAVTIERDDLLSRVRPSITSLKLTFYFILNTDLTII